MVNFEWRILCNLACLTKNQQKENVQLIDTDRNIVLLLLTNIQHFSTNRWLEKKIFFVLLCCEDTKYSQIWSYAGKPDIQPPAHPLTHPTHPLNHSLKFEGGRAGSLKTEGRLLRIIKQNVRSNGTCSSNNIYFCRVLALLLASLLSGCIICFYFFIEI